MNNSERAALILEKYSEEVGNEPSCIWMSFCDPDKPKGQQFLGVVIVKTKGFIHAKELAWDLGINPGGEILFSKIDGSDIKPEHFNKLLSHEDLIEAGYI